MRVSKRLCAAAASTMRADGLSVRERLAAIVTIWMFLAILPVCSLLRALQLVEGTINLMPFRPPVPVPAVFAIIPSMVVPLVAVVVPPLVYFVPLSGILTAVVSKIVAGLHPHRAISATPKRSEPRYLCIRCMLSPQPEISTIGVPADTDCTPPAL